MGGGWFFDRYDHDAVELWVMDLRMADYGLRRAAAVNLEPRFSRMEKARVCLHFL